MDFLNITLGQLLNCFFQRAKNDGAEIDVCLSF